MDCRTCRYNSYGHLDVIDYVMCCHPITLAKMPKWELGDPVWVNVMTADLSLIQLAAFTALYDCPKWEERERAEPKQEADESR